MRVEQIERLYASLTRCGDDVLGLAEQLQTAGFAAIGPRREFRASFCSNDADRALHQKYAIEIAKTALARQQPTQWFESKTFYRSQLLDELRQRRDLENGCDGREIRNRFPGEVWRLEIDPCNMRLAQARMKDKSFESRWQSVVESESQILAAETLAHATGLGRSFAFDPAGRHAFLDRVLERELAPFAFAFDRQKSSLGYSVFSKKLYDDLDLCWSLEEVDFFVAFDGNYRPTLQLRRPNVRGKLSRAAKENPANLLLIDYVAAVPDFQVAYWKFRNLDELETIVKAHVYLYGLLAQRIDDAVRDAFSS